MIGEQTLMIQRRLTSRRLAAVGTVLFAFSALLGGASVAAHLAGLKVLPGLAEAPTNLNVGAFLFVLSVSGALFRRRLDIAPFASGMLGALGGGALLAECLAREDLGAAELLLGDAAAAGQVPSLAFALLFASFALFTLSKARHSRLRLTVPALASVGAIGVSGLAILGDILEVPGVSGGLDPLAAEAFLALSIGVLLEAASEIRAEISSGPRSFLPVSLGGLVLFIALVVSTLLSQTSADSIQEKVRESANEASISVLNVIGAYSKQLNKLADSFPQGSEPLRASWEATAGALPKELPGLSSLALLDAQGAPVWQAPLQKVVPLAATNPLFVDAQAKVVAAARTTKRMQFSPVVPAGRNVYGFLVALPLLGNGEVVHVLLAGVNLERFFNFASFPDGFRVEVRQRQDVIYSQGAMGDEAIGERWAVSARVPTARVTWSVSMAPTISKLRSLDSGTANFVLFGGIVLSLIVALLEYFRILSGEQESVADYRERKFQASAALTPLCLFRATPEGEFLGVNPVWEGITGLDEQESRGEGWKRCVPPEDRAQLEADWQGGLASREEFPLSFRLNAKDGNPYRFTGKVRLIEGAQPGTTELVGALGVGKE